jgi:uncharacterized protein YdhG (YjbR/CyaY superfamily)
LDGRSACEKRAAQEFEALSAGEILTTFDIELLDCTEVLLSAQEFLLENGDTSMKRFQTVDEYLSALPKEVRDALEELRAAIRQAAPQAEEVISYNMPAFKSDGMLVWYSAFKKHVGFYPKPTAIVAFREELAGYKTSKGAIQFPLEKGIPTNLVKKIIKFRLKENKQKQKGKKQV